MKLEALLLKLVSRILEVGFKEPYEKFSWARGQTAVTKECHCICDCQCSDALNPILLLLALICPAINLVCFCRRRGFVTAEQSHDNPRRRGRGLVTMPSR